MNKRTQRLMQLDLHEVLNIKGKDRHIQLNSHKKNRWNAVFATLSQKGNSVTGIQFLVCSPQTHRTYFDVKKRGYFWLNLLTFLKFVLTSIHLSKGAAFFARFHVHPAKTYISLCIIVFAVRLKMLWTLRYPQNAIRTDQNAQKRRLICIRWGHMQY